MALVNQRIDPILNDEHSDFRWCTIGEITELLDWKNQRDGVLAAENLLKSREELIGSLEILWSFDGLIRENMQYFSQNADIINLAFLKINELS